MYHKDSEQVIFAFPRIRWLGLFFFFFCCAVCPHGVIDPWSCLNWNVGNVAPEQGRGCRKADCK